MSPICEIILAWNLQIVVRKPADPIPYWWFTPTLPFCQENNRHDYERDFPTKGFPDLNQLVRTGRPRYELADGTLQCLTTNTCIWSQDRFGLGSTNIIIIQGEVKYPQNQLQSLLGISRVCAISGINHSVLEYLGTSSFSGKLWSP